MNKSYLYTIAAAFFVLLGIGLTSCSGNGGVTKRYDEGSTIMYADEGCKSYMEQEIDVFEYQYPKAYVLSKYMAENEVINSLLADSCDVAVISRPLTRVQLDYLKQKRNKIARQQEIAVDAVALIINKDNPIGALSVQEIKEIMSGKINQWSQLAWADTAHIKIVFDHEGSANVNFIRDKFLPADGHFPAGTFAQNSNADVIKVVEQDKYAIGFVSVSWLGEHLERVKSQKVDSTRISQLEDEDEITAVDFTDRVRVLKVRRDDSPVGFAPYQAYIYSGEYPLVRTIYMVTTSGSKSVGQSFFSFVTGFIGQKILVQTGVLPYHYHARVVELE